MKTKDYRYATRQEIWRGIKEADKFYSCALCGEPVPHEDFQPEYVAAASGKRYACHSACYEQAAMDGHNVAKHIQPSRILVGADYSIFSTNPKQSCQERSNSSSLPPSPRWGQSLTRARKSPSNPLTARVKLAIPATLLAAIATPKRWSGLLLLVLAPIAEVCYRLFDRSAGDPSDYWNAFYFMQSVGPHLSGLLVASAFFLLLHDRMRSWAILPGAYKLAKIVWLTQVTTNEQYHQFVPWSFLLIGLCASVLWFMSIDYLLSLHFHKREGIIARILGIISAPGIPDDERIRIARDQAKQLEAI